VIEVAVKRVVCRQDGDAGRINACVTLAWARKKKETRRRRRPAVGRCDGMVYACKARQ